MDFKVSYLDAGLTYFSDQDSNPVTAMVTTPTPAPKARRYKTQLRDFLASCRSKRKIVGGEYPVEPSTAVGPSASIQHIQQAAVAAASYTAPYNCSVYGGLPTLLRTVTSMFINNKISTTTLPISIIDTWTLPPCFSTGL